VLIRREQFEVLLRVAFDRALRAWAREFREEYQQETVQYSDAELENVIAKGARVAETLGMTSMPEIRECLAVMIETGVDAYGRPAVPWIRDILESRDLSVIGKFAEIAARRPPRDNPAQDAEALSEAADISAEKSDVNVLGSPNEPDLPVAPRFHTEPEDDGGEDEPQASW